MGADITGQIACAWINQWIQAVKSGDMRAADEAITAMTSSRDWAILNEMNAAGDYPEVVWEYATAMANDGTITAGQELTVEQSYKQALGCP